MTHQDYKAEITIWESSYRTGWPWRRYDKPIWGWQVDFTNGIFIHSQVGQCGFANTEIEAITQAKIHADWVIAKITRKAPKNKKTFAYNG